MTTRNRWLLVSVVMLGVAAAHAAQADSALDRARRAVTPRPPFLLVQPGFLAISGKTTVSEQQDMPSDGSPCIFSYDVSLVDEKTHASVYVAFGFNSSWADNLVNGHRYLFLVRDSDQPLAPSIADVVVSGKSKLSKEFRINEPDIIAIMELPDVVAPK